MQFFYFLLLSVILAVVEGQSPSAAPAAAPAAAPIYQVSVHSGYLVGMGSRHVFPVITIVPFFIVLFFAIIFYRNLGGEAEFNTGTTGLALAITTILLSFAQFAVTVAAYSKLHHPRVGSWWIGISVFFAALFAVVGKNRSLGIFATILLLSSFLIGLICTIGDGLYYTHVLRSVVACENKDGTAWSSQIDGGDDGDLSLAGICHSESPDRDLSCINREGSRCFYFDGITNGHTFFHEYTWLFETGFVFDILLVTSVTLLLLWQIWILIVQKHGYDWLHPQTYYNPANRKEIQLESVNPQEVQLVSVNPKEAQPETVDPNV